MVLPVVESTWTFDVNNVAGDGSTPLQMTRDFWYKWKETAKTLGLPVLGSCNGSTAGNNDNVDRWTDLTKVKGPGITTWIVIGLPGLGANSALMLDTTYVNDSYINTLQYSSTGFGLAKGGVNGSTSAAPTGAAATTWTIGTGVLIHPGAANIETFHCALGSNGTFRTVVTDGGGTRALICFEKIKEPHATWTHPVMTFVRAWSGAAWSISEIQSYPAQFISKIGGTSLGLYVTCEGVAVTERLAQWGSIPQSDDGSGWPMLPIGIACTTVGHRNWRKGQMSDMWWGHYNISSGDTYPTTVGQKRKFIQFGQLIMPWDGLVIPDGTPIDMS